MDVNYIDVVCECAKTEEFIKEFNRIKNHSVDPANAKSLDEMVAAVREFRSSHDEKEVAEVSDFLDFIFQYIWHHIEIDISKKISGQSE